MQLRIIVKICLQKNSTTQMFEFVQRIFMDDRFVNLGEYKAGCAQSLFTFTFMHLSDAFIQSDLLCIQAIHFFVSTCVPWESNPQPLRC